MEFAVMLLGYCILVLTLICVVNTQISLKLNGVTIVGKKLKTIFKNNPYAAFYKIPYAKSPLNTLRFKVSTSVVSQVSTSGQYLLITLIL